MTVASRRGSENARALEIVDAPVADLHGWARNPRRITDARLEQLKAMLEASPEMLRARPLIALPDGTVIAGNQRLAAVQALGWETVPVVYADLDEATATRWAFADNNAMGEPDDDLAAQLLAELGAADVDLLLTGFAPDETSRLLASLNRREADPDLAPEVPAVAKSVRGEVYELGPHRLMCGDATSAEDVAVLLDGAEPWLMVTDPPYGVSLDMEWRDRAGHNEMGPASRSYMKIAMAGEGMSGDTRADWSDAYALVPSLTVAYVWHATSHLIEVGEGLTAKGFDLRQQIVWTKTVAAMSRSAYNWKHEPCWYAVKKGSTAKWHGGHGQTTVWEAASPKHIMSGSKETKYDHPTQKPVVLYTIPYENHAASGDIVYEPFGGSGSAVVAAEMIGMRCLAMEVEPRFCDVIRQRYADYTGDQQWAPR